MDWTGTNLRTWLTGLLGVALLTSAPALAGPGDHVQAGPVTIIPELSVGVEAASNAYRSEKNEVAGFNFVLSPGLILDVRHPKVRFKLDGRYELRKFFDPNQANLDRFTDFKANLRLDAFPTGVVGFSIRDKATLSNQANDQEWRNNSLISQLRNTLYGGLAIRPGPEFQIDPGFSWSFHNFRIPDADNQLDFNTRNSLTPSLDLAWRFFPNTAFVVEATYDMNRWTTNWAPTNQAFDATLPDGSLRGLGEFLALPDSDHFKAVTGVRGRFTKHLVLVVLAGYGFGDYDEASVAEEAALNPGLGSEADAAEAGFDQDVSLTDAILVTIRPEFDLGWGDKRTFGQLISVTYRKDFADSFFTNYVHQHHVMAGLDSRWGRMVQTHLDGGVRFETYVGEVSRNDIFARVGLDIDVAPVPFFAIRAGAAWVRRDSSDNTVDYDNIQGRFLLTFVY